ncbi:MAG: hypothetical protein FJ125_10525, partial [Deltaproteobacteria bacterium]|nr:hypothetical protein [Deltaproteobacteria bacterium]
VDLEQGTIDTAGYFAQLGERHGTPVSDPWLDMLLSPTPAPEALTEQQKGWYYRDIWSNFSISDVMIDRFPAYKALRTKARNQPETLTQDDLLQMKGWFELAWFDPDFLRGAVALPSGDTVDLSDLVTANDDGTFTLAAPFTEEICRRLVIEDYKVMANVVAIHRQLIFDAVEQTGQIEVMTTPYYHPILPLVTDSELARVAMPNTAMPASRFLHPEDAHVHVAKAVKLFGEQFGKPVTGMWPAEGSVAEQVVEIFSAHGVKWVATDRRVLERSTPPDQPIYSPYRIDADILDGDGGDPSDELAIVFRDTEVADKLGFHYQGGTADQNVADLLHSLRRHAPPYGEERLLTIVLDGENAWEWYRKDNDAKGFLRLMYRTFEELQESGELRTATVSEYLAGNQERMIPPHPVHDLPELEPLWAGSWIYGDFSTWIGEEEENLAWDYLQAVRGDLAAFEALGLARPAVDAAVPEQGSAQWYAYKAWETMYAAEGSDWFWWYGSDQEAMGGDEPFDRIFRKLLQAVYRYAQLAGIQTDVPDLPPILRFCRPPRGQLAGPPTLDGAFEPDDGGQADQLNEWTALGAGVCMDIDSGVALDPADDIAAYYWGTTADSVYVALRMNEDLAARVLTGYELRLYFSHKHIVSLDGEGQFELDDSLPTTRAGEPIDFKAGGAAREITIQLLDQGNAPMVAVPFDATQWGARTDAEGVEVGMSWAGDAATVLEVKIPFALLNYQASDPLEMLITAVERGEGGSDVEVDRAPNRNAIVLFSDRSLLVELTLVLDATGTRLPLTAHKAIDDPPPPA